VFFSGDSPDSALALTLAEPSRAKALEGETRSNAESPTPSITDTGWPGDFNEIFELPVMCR
jgi:hypothetical protein